MQPIDINKNYLYKNMTFCSWYMVKFICCNFVLNPHILLYLGGSLWNGETPTPQWLPLYYTIRYFPSGTYFQAFFCTLRPKLRSPKIQETQIISQYSHQKSAKLIFYDTSRSLKDLHSPDICDSPDKLQKFKHFSTQIRIFSKL